MPFLVGLIGFIAGAIGPLFLGIKAQQGLTDYANSVKADGLEVCGLPAIVPLALFFVVTPICGLIGAVVATGFAAVAATRSLDTADDLRSQ